MIKPAFESSAGVRQFPLGWTEAEFAQDAQIYELHVTGVEERLREHVGERMRAESPPELVAERVVDDAYNLLIGELPKGEVEQRTAELNAARERAKASLREAIRTRSDEFAVTDSDVALHSRAAAQCLVSNWHSHITRSLEEAGGTQPTVTLDAKWLPKGSTPEDLLLGMSAFAVEPEFALDALRHYLEYSAGSERHLQVDLDTFIVGQRGLRTAVRLDRQRRGLDDPGAIAASAAAAMAEF